MTSSAAIKSKFEPATDRWAIPSNLAKFAFSLFYIGVVKHYVPALRSESSLTLLDWYDYLRRAGTAP